MSHYKSTIRAQPQQDSSETVKYRSEARQLQELFPTWTNDDLQLLLTDLNGDVQLAATRISDGTVEPWGEVSRKRDKKAPTTVQPSKPSTSGRGDFRGARGGRGGRGGPGRGGAVTRGRGGPHRAGANGHATHADTTSITPVNGHSTSWGDSNGAADASAKPSAESLEQNGIPSSTSGWTDSSSQPETATLATSVSAANSSWGNGTETTNGHATSHTAANKQPSKTPATSKMSWAQIARPQEKPAPPAAISKPRQHSPPVAAPPVSSAPEVQSTPVTNGWEEPTTVEAPTWDEPKQVADAWPPSTEETSPPELPAEVPAEEKAETHEELSSLPTAVEVVPEVKPEPKAASSVSTPITTQTPSVVSTIQTATPSPKLASRPAVSSHRNSARYKIPDQPVTLPVSFGTGMEKVGMQFGSLSLGGESAVGYSQSESEAPAAVSEHTPAPSVHSGKPQSESIAPPPPATAPAASSSLTSVFQQQQQPPSQPQPQTLPVSQGSVPHHTLPTSISQPIQSTQASHAAASPLQQFAQQQQTSTQQQQSLTPNVSQQQQAQHPQAPPNLHQQTQHLPHLPQQLQQNQAAVHSYTQHGLPTHIEPSQQQTQTPIQQQPLQSTATHASYFRGGDTASATPYFHTPTPPVAQSQESSYGSFGQLGGQGQHQQGSHLGSFANNDYGYNDNTRGFYDSYGQQQQGFGSRTLGHDDVKGLQGAQQPAASAIPPSTAQGPQTHSSQASNQPQPTGQGPQQSYPPPLPYYYTHAYPQNQYYGTPYSSGYVPQPFVKYPTMFQPGPPGPGSASNPATKQPGGNVGVGVQPQSNPYNQALYQQAGYDDYQGHPHHSQHQHQHNHSLGLSQGVGGVGTGDYGKQLYGGAGQGSMQGFMGLSGQSGTGGTGPTSNAGPRGGTSPETSYKPYAAKDVGVTSGRSVPGQQGQGQVQPQTQGQGPAGQGGPQGGQGFYGGNRFGSGGGAAAAGGVGGGPQQGGPQAHLGYPQGVNEQNFYGYQPRQQQGYWQ